MAGIDERIEMAGYTDGRASRTTTNTIYRNSQWTPEQADAYRRQFLQGMAYSVLKGECRIVPGGRIDSEEHAAVCPDCGYVECDCFERITPDC